MKRIAWAAVLAASFALPAAAGVNYYGLYHTAYYSQDSDFPPSAPTSCYLLASIGASTNGDLLAADLITPTPESIPFYDASYNNGTYFLCSAGPYATTSDLVTAQPSGIYTWTLSAGSAAPDSGQLNAKPEDFSLETPYVSNLSGLQMLPSNTDAVFQFPAFTHVGTMPEASTDMYLVDYTSALSLTAFSGPASSTEYTMPAAEVKSGHTYAFNLIYRAWEQITGAGFVSADSYQEYGRATGGYFHCAADPGTVAGKLTLSGYYYPLGQPVTVQVYDSGNNLLDEQTITLGYEGYYAFDTAATGVVTVTFKNPRFLRLAVENVDLGVGQDFVNPVLINGDVDDDNVVSVFDYIILSDSFDAVPGDPTWDARADLDGDAVVSVFDYIILSDSFDQSGWEPA